MLSDGSVLTRSLILSTVPCQRCTSRKISRISRRGKSLTIPCRAQPADEIAINLRVWLFSCLHSERIGDLEGGNNETSCFGIFKTSIKGQISIARVETGSFALLDVHKRPTAQRGCLLSSATWVDGHGW